MWQAVYSVDNEFLSLLCRLYLGGMALCMCAMARAVSLERPLQGNRWGSS